MFRVGRARRSNRCEVPSPPMAAAWMVEGLSAKACALGLPALWAAALTLRFKPWVRLPEKSGLRAMRIGLALAILIGIALPAAAADGFDIVIPGRPGVPIIINGV